MRKINSFSQFITLVKEDQDPKKVDFRQAFAQARRSNQKTFTWNGKPYTTDLKDVKIVDKNTGNNNTSKQSGNVNVGQDTSGPSNVRTIYVDNNSSISDPVGDPKRGRDLYLKFVREKRIISRKAKDGEVLLVISETINQKDQDDLIIFLEKMGYVISLSPEDYESGDGVIFRKTQKNRNDSPSQEIIMPEAQTENDQKQLELNGKKLWNEYSKNKSLVTRKMDFGNILVFKGQITDLQKLELSAFAKNYGWIVTTTTKDYKSGDTLIFRKSENIENVPDLEKPTSETEIDKKDSIEKGKELYKKLVKQKTLVSRSFSFGDVWVYLGQYGTLDAILEENLIDFLNSQGYVKSNVESDRKDKKELVFRKKEDLQKKEGDKPTEQKTETTDQNTENSDDNVIPPPSENRVEKIKELPNDLISKNQDIPREERCKRLFIDLDDRDRRRGEKTGSNEEIEECKYCLQQYNWISRSKERIKQRYGLKGSGGSKSL